MRFRWSSVDGRKRCKNASVDEKLFIRFQETENGGFRKRISVDRAIERTKKQTFPNRKVLLNSFNPSKIWSYELKAKELTDFSSRWHLPYLATKL